MKKTGLIILLLLLVAAVSGAAVSEDKDFSAGLRYYNAKNYKAAVTQLTEYVNRKPDPTAYYLLGYSLYKLGRFSEADEYFSQAYLIDPEFSPEKAGLITEPMGEIAPEKPVVKKRRVKVPVTKAVESEARQPEPAAKEAPPAKQKPIASGAAPVPATEPKQASPKQQAAPVPAPAPIPAPSDPVAKPHQMHGRIPDAAAPLLVGLMATFGLFIFLFAIAFYVFVSLCLFKIAKKLNVEPAWTAWIPIVNIWTIVTAAGKPAWWLILCIIPIVNAFVFIYLYMCITENLGKNKWLGLLMLVPLVNLGFLGWLAFSNPESPASPGLE